jgi:ABC-type polysaccharide/polyol phosphate export permease
MAFYHRPARLVSLAIGTIAVAVTFAFDHLDSMDDGRGLIALKGVAMCLILPGILCSALVTNIHDPNLIVAAICNLLFYFLTGVIVTAIVRVYRKQQTPTKR